jgi:hypothetical protein
VSVTNNSGVTVQSVVVKFTGGLVKLGPLQTGERQESEIKPATDSHLEIDIYSNKKVIRQCHIDIYLDNNSTGKVEIFLEQNLTIKALIKLPDSKAYSDGCKTRIRVREGILSMMQSL